jgi:hypothetical protein
MKLELAQPCMEPFDPANDMRVLIACENSMAAGQACAMLEHIGRSSGLQGRLIYQWWNFDILSIASLQDLAAREAAEADMIIIAVQVVKKLPRDLTEWMAGWMENRQGRRGAMVALLDSSSEDKDAFQGFFLQLRELAAQGHMDFFAKIAGEDGTTGGSFLTMGGTVGGGHRPGIPA